MILCLFFKKDISCLIRKVSHIGKEGANFGPDQSNDIADRDPKKEAEQLLRALDSQLLCEQEDIIKKELNERKLHGEEAVKVLVRYLAATQIAHAFEMLYRNIWGSQIKMLEALNCQTNGFARETLKLFYDEAVRRYPEAYVVYTFEQWLEFLRGWLLVTEDTMQYKITVRGREFLLYLTRNGFDKNKFY